MGFSKEIWLLNLMAGYDSGVFYQALFLIIIITRLSKGRNIYTQKY
jgi:hypothetical protein